jgi:hypothetical protein
VPFHDGFNYYGMTEAVPFHGRTMRGCFGTTEVVPFHDGFNLAHYPQLKGVAECFTQTDAIS